MDVIYEIHHTDVNGFLLVKTSQKMSADGFIAMAEDLLTHSSFFPHGHVLFDHTELNFKDVTIDDLQAIRTFHKNNEIRIGHGKSAIVVKPGFADRWHKLWSQGEKIKTSNQVQVFEDYRGAVAWIQE